MAKNHGNSVKKNRKYEDLRDKGYMKERSAKIANSGKKSSRKGGKHSHGALRPSPDQLGNRTSSLATGISRCLTTSAVRGH